MSDDDDTPDRADPRLRTALEHAPDQQLRPSPALREAVLERAHEVAKEATRRAPRERASAWWRQPWFGGPGMLGVAASIATAGLAISLAWRLSHEPGPEADAGRALPVPAPMSEMQETAPPPATQPSAAAPPAAAFAPPPERARARAAPPANKRPIAAEERVTTAAVEPPAPAASGDQIGRSVGLAESRHKGAQAPELAAAAEAPRVQDSAAAPAPVAKAAAPMALRQEASSSAPWPSPLARWRQALLEVGADVDLPAGWQRLQPAQASGTPASRREWWLGLLNRSAGRWQPGTATARVGTVWQLRSPEGETLTLWLDVETLWLQAEGRTWRAPRPAGMADAP